MALGLAIDHIGFRSLHVVRAQTAEPRAPGFKFRLALFVSNRGILKPAPDVQSGLYSESQESCFHSACWARWDTPCLFRLKSRDPGSALALRIHRWLSWWVVALNPVCRNSGNRLQREHDHVIALTSRTSHCFHLEEADKTRVSWQAAVFLVRCVYYLL